MSNNFIQWKNPTQNYSDNPKSSEILPHYQNRLLNMSIRNSGSFSEEGKLCYTKHIPCLFKHELGHELTSSHINGSTNVITEQY